VLDEGPGFKVKRIEVLPGKRLSYQRHKHRCEHWMVVRGEGKMTVDGDSWAVPVGATVDIQVGDAHRIENPGAELLVFIEIQRGSYLGEDDIERLEDDFGRAPAPPS
jgi:mannose-6-phosphate isomerase-like protein (cupin superfamily)